MEPDTKESGMNLLTKEMEGATKFGQMVLYMKDIGKTIKQMEEVD